MGKSFLFAILGIGILLSFFLLLMEERNREWKKYQREFKKMDMEIMMRRVKNAANEKERRRQQKALDGLAKASVEVKQVYLKDLEVTDRCHTCHLGIDDQRWAEVPQPFTSHTEPILSSHPVSSFGCSLCHQGQGLATTTKSGHGFEANWKDPLLPLNYIEASCSQCHSDLTFREAPLLSRGKYLVGRLGCLGCHEGSGFKAEEKIGSVLDKISLKVDPDWISRFLKDPGEYSKETRMPNFQFKDAEIEQILKYLSTLSEGDEDREAKKTKRPDDRQLTPMDLENTKKLIKDMACNTCHTIKGIEEEGFFKPDKIGPELSRVGSKLSTEWLQGYLMDPSSYQPKSRMPKYRLSDKEARELAIFLKSLRWEEADRQHEKKNALPQVPKVSNGAGGDEVETGRRLIIKSNCIGCHEIKGIKEGERGPAWNGIAGRPIRKFDFGENPDQVEMSKSAWIKAKIVKPRSFRNSLKMPILDISGEDATAITTALLGLTDRKVPKKYIKEDKGTAVSPVRIPMKGPVGKLWNELKCLQCHSVGGTGGDIGPELTFEGSRVKYDWLVRYLKKPEPIRPISAARMPDLKLSEQEAALLSDFIIMSLVDNELPAGTVREGKISKKTYKRGKKLFSRKYGCIGCHQVDGKGGKIGPEVSRLGKRLNGDWVYTYLKNPQSAMPGAMMPNFALKDEDARALTEYLLSLGADAPKRGEISANKNGKVTGDKR